MKKLLAACAALVCIASAAAADTIENSFDNTIAVSMPDGVTLNYHFDSDGTFAMTAPDGSSTNGIWDKRGAQLCLTLEEAAESCFPYVGDKDVGDTWTMQGANGAQISVSIIEGR